MGNKSLKKHFAGGIAAAAAALVLPISVAFADELVHDPALSAEGFPDLPIDERAGLAAEDPEEMAGANPAAPGLPQDRPGAPKGDADVTRAAPPAPTLPSHVDPANPRGSLPNPYLIFRW